MPRFLKCEPSQQVPMSPQEDPKAEVMSKSQPHHEVQKGFLGLPKRPDSVTHWQEMLNCCPRVSPAAPMQTGQKSSQGHRKGGPTALPSPGRGGRPGPSAGWAMSCSEVCTIYFLHSARFLVCQRTIKNLHRITFEEWWVNQNVLVLRQSLIAPPIDTHIHCHETYRCNLVFWFPLFPRDEYDHYSVTNDHLNLYKLIMFSMDTTIGSEMWS